MEIALHKIVSIKKYFDGNSIERLIRLSDILPQSSPALSQATRIRTRSQTVSKPSQLSPLPQVDGATDHNLSIPHISTSVAAVARTGSQSLTLDYNKLEGWQRHMPDLSDQCLNVMNRMTSDFDGWDK